MSRKHLILNANSCILVIGRWDTFCICQKRQTWDGIPSLNQVYPMREFNRLKRVHANYCTYQSWYYVGLMLLLHPVQSHVRFRISNHLHLYQKFIVKNKRKWYSKKKTYQSLRLVNHRPTLFLRFPHLGKYKLELEYFFLANLNDSKPWSAFKITTHTISLVAFCSSLSAFATLPLSLPEEDLPLLAFCSAFLSFLWVFRS